MKLYSHRNAANNRHIIKHRKIHKKHDDNNYSDNDDARKLILAANTTIQHQCEMWNLSNIGIISIHYYARSQTETSKV